MKPLEKVRNILFWKFDKITSKGIKRHYEEIQNHIDDPRSEQALRKQQANLINLLNHAIETTGFYSKIAYNTKLSNFPVVDKNLIRDNYNKFYSKKFINKVNHQVSTSGSTGTPFKVIHDTEKRNRSIADNLCFSENVGYKLGFKLMYFRFWNAFEKKGFFQKHLQNMIPVDVFDLSDTEELQKTLHIIEGNKNSSFSCIGYASAFEKICKYLDSTDREAVDNNIKSAIAISEHLNEYTKQAFKKYFGSVIYSRYSNIENGIIAQQLPGTENYFVINEASYIVEILKIDSNHLQVMGKPGRIVITDLFNYSMPMIRYDTGDIGIYEEVNGNRMLTDIKGRKIDTLTNTAGEIINFNLVLIVNKYLELKQCQLIQKAQKKYVFKINVKNKFEREKQFIEEFKKYLGADANITVVYVDEIPLLASGKTRMMVNEML